MPHSDKFALAALEGLGPNMLSSFYTDIQTYTCHTQINRQAYVHIQIHMQVYRHTNT